MRVFAAEAVALLEVERLLRQDLGQHSDHRRVIEQGLQHARMAILHAAGALLQRIDAGVALGAHRLQLRPREHGRQHEPAAQVEEELLFIGHRHRRPRVVGIALHESRYPADAPVHTRRYGIANLPISLCL